MKIRTKDNFKLDIVYHKTAGAKKVVVLAHGMTVDKDDETIFVIADNKLQKHGLSTIRFDFRSHGKSQGNSITDFTISNELKDLEAIIDFAKKEGYFWIGLAGASFGGSIAALYAGRNPRQIQKLLLVFPVLDYSKCFLNPTTSWAKKYFTNIFERIDKKGYIEVASRKFKVGKKLFEEMSQYNPCQELHNYKTPIMIIHGDSDTYIPYEHALDCFNKLNNGNKKIELVKGGEHGFETAPHENDVANMVEKSFSEE